jgi:hypothetical protein
MPFIKKMTVSGIPNSFTAFQLLNQLTDFLESYYEYYASGSHPQDF